MNIILLSGGSGKRLWPISNNSRSKQFIKIFKNDKNEYESMVQRIYNQIINIDSNSTVTIATSQAQVPYIKNQLGEKVRISIEPCRKDTFPAIALAGAYLKDIQNVEEDEVVVVCPVDPYVDEKYFNALKKISEVAKQSDSNIVLMGIEPTYASEKFGYIIPKDANEISEVDMFKEKPDKKTAEEYIKQNALWNGGVFAFKLKYLINKAKQLIDFTDYNDLFNRYESLNKISFDYAIVEKEPKISVVRFSSKWEDLGTWNTLTSVLDDKVIGNGQLNDACENTNIINELNIPVLGIDLKNIVIAVSDDGILVSDKEKADSIKEYVDNLESEPTVSEMCWGSIKILDKSSNDKTELMLVKSGNELKIENSNGHEKLIVLSGKGKLITTDNNEITIEPGYILNNYNNMILIATDNIKLIKISINL